MPKVIRKEWDGFRCSGEMKINITNNNLKRKKTCERKEIEKMPNLNDAP
jgi:hypothetical protein